MKTNILKTGIALIIVIACSFSLISKDKSSDDWQSSDDYQVAKETTDSGWVQKDGYLENALQVGSISYFRYSNDGQYLFTFGSDYTFRKWDVKTGKVVKEKKFEDVYKLKFDLNDDDETYAIINTYNYASDLEIYKIDSLIYKLDIFELYSKEDYCNYENVLINFLKDKYQININYDCSCYSSQHHSTNGANFIVDYGSSKVIHKDHNGNATNLTLSKNGKYLLYSNYSYSYENDDYDYRYYYYLILKNLENNSIKSIKSDNNFEPYHSLAFSNNSKFLVSTRNDSYTLVWDIENQKTKYRIFIPNLIYNKFSADDRFLISTLVKKDTSILKFFLAETGVEADSIYFASKSHNGLIAVAPDSESIAIAGNDGRIRIFQPKIFTVPFKTYFAADSIFKQLGNAIQFSDYSLPNATNWHWDFGDGETSNEQNPIHYYNAKGLYTVILISSNGIQTDTMIKKDYVRMFIPIVANFETYISQDTVPFNIKFNNTSQGDIISYTWIINDKVVSKEENPIINFTYWGDYDVSLIVSDGYFSDTLFIKEKILGIPPAIPFFINLLEKRYYFYDLSIKGIDGIQTNDGGYLLVGDVYYLIYYGEEEDDIEYRYYYTLLIKTDSFGNIDWKKNAYKMKNIIKTEDSCFLVIGSVWTDRNIFLIRKFTQNGDSLWEKSYFNQGNDIAINACSTEDGGYILIGESDYYQSYRTAVLRIDKDGNQIWYKLFSGFGGDVLNTKGGNFLLVIKDTKNADILLNKINKDGKILWTKQYGSDKNMLSYDALAIKNEEFVIAGGIGNNGISTTYFLKVDSLGEKICEYIGDSPNSCYYSISSISDTLFAASGNFNNQLGVDIINNQGELVNSVRFPERVGEIKSIVTTKDNDLFLTGSITPPYKLSQLYTLLLKHPYIITSVEEEQTENIANPELPFSIFPNPTNSTATLQYKIETPTNLKIEIIDFMGTKVSELENTYKEVGKYNTLINFENLAIAKGVYFVRFIANGNVFVSKVIFY